MLDVVRQEADTALTPERLRAANIHPKTWLATDYLNHFNEVIMLLELVPDMPDCLEDVLGWEPATYEEHFIRSHYRDRALVLAAFAEAPAATRTRFLTLVADMDATMTAALADLRVHAGTPAAGRIAAETASHLKHLVTRTAGVMNAAAREDDGPTQDAVDALMTR